MKKNILFLLALAAVNGYQAQASNVPSRMAVVAQKESKAVTGYLDFLYRYMSLPDKADYSRNYYRENVELSLQARHEMPWGASIPEREFRHFVLPIRVNNENLDESRKVFYGELKNRVKGLSMYNAILEVNHWCHEKVTYRPSDSRTSSPLASVCTAYGRCGEESTFLVAALRSVGIPARQVYTPRWAHTDDNHAWVEAWADGKWYFLGACEPEPVLNLGWFNESASRGMLMHTKVFGNYDGPEEVMSRTATYTEINVIGHYAPSAQVKVLVTDAQGKPVNDATVDFKIYNYAEFYTVGTKHTDARGMASLTAGKGDMLVWVAKNGLIAAQKVSFGKTSLLKIVLKDRQLPAKMDFDVVPPPVSAKLPTVTEEQRAGNTLRMAKEDSIRHAYEATMKNEASRGNHATIDAFLTKATNKVMAQKLLDVLTAKDLRDVQLDVLLDNMVEQTDTSDIFCKYVLNPRVENEWLTPYKHELARKMTSVKSPTALAEWCKKNIKIDDVHNPQGMRMQPLSVLRERVTDRLGRQIFFVSTARSLGWPARINEVNRKLQYFENAHWTDVNFSAGSLTAAPAKGKLLLNYTPTKYNDNPKYYSHFTISKIQDGLTYLQTFGEDATWKTDFAKGVELDEGTYMLTCGTRMADGTVLAHNEVFEVKGGETTRVTFTLRESTDAVQVIGSLNAENIYHDLTTNTNKGLIATTGRGYYLLAVVAPNQEPTNHTLRDISTYKKQFEQWGRSMVLLFPDADHESRFNYKEFGNLPKNVVWGTDVDGKIQSEIREQMKLTSPSLPIFLICDTFNRVVYVQQGYTINIGEQIMKVIQKL